MKQRRTLSLLAKASSQPTPYGVTFYFEPKGITVWCECAAGEFGKWCKHKIGMLRGDESLLAKPSQISLLNELRAIIASSDYPALLSEFDMAEAELAKAQDRVKKLRSAIEKKMKKAA